MFKYVAFCITLLALSSLSLAVQCESLWPGSAANSMVADKRASKIGDVLTIVIIESATSTQAASTSAKKDSKTNVGPGVGPLISNIPMFSYSGGDSMKADGSTSRTSNFVAKITVKVIGIDSNGNLQIEGTRSVQTNKENADMKLTGTVRPEDIATDNTVQSSYIADAKISYQGNGPIGSRQKEGIISKILGFLF